MGYDPILTTSMFLWLTCLHAMIQFVFCQGNKTVVENLPLLQKFRLKTDTPLVHHFVSILDFVCEAWARHSKDL